MQYKDPPRPPALDEETIAFAQRIFQHTRAGHAEELAHLLDMGLPPNLRNEKGDSLLMLACYHGHAEVAQALLDHGGDPELANDLGQTPLREQHSRATPRSSVCSWGMGRTLTAAALMAERH